MTNTKTTSLDSIFDITYGSQLDLNKLEIDLKNGVNFISRSRENLGVKTKVKKISNKTIFKKGSISVTLGGSYLLSAFVQQNDFYTGQNVKVLSSKIKLTDAEKKFYCYVISHNRFRYTSHGREANKTLDYLPVPTVDSIPSWVNKTKIKIPSKKSLFDKKLTINTEKWEYFYYKDIFDIKKGITPKNKESGKTNLISATSLNNGVSKQIKSDKNPYIGGKITVSSNGAVGDAFYQKNNFFATGDVNILMPKFNLNPYIAMFLNTVISKEQFRFNYGRKWGKEKMLTHKIKLPVKDKLPDWQFMEDYIKSLEFSSNL
ncbi:MAG: hypothetical protein DRQ51_07725 [Gammaproteobacteria bacterium]|nr:MAG: hypothetical protein DRQ51_07725 [Gammaproteobacteria bacterium]